MKRINFPAFWNKASKIKQRITEGSNVTRQGATIILTQPQRFGIGLDDYMRGIRSARECGLHTAGSDLRHLQ